MSTAHRSCGSGGCGGRTGPKSQPRKYREAFGCLDFSSQGDRAPLVTEPRVVRPQGWRDRSPGVGQLAYGLPDEILEAGMTLATGVIHTLSAASFWVCDEERRPSQPLWPESSGGLETLRRIFERHRESRQPGFWRAEPPERTFDVKLRKSYASASHHEFLVDPVLHGLLLPEQNRQQREMIEAINRVCDLVQGLRNRTISRNA